MNSLIVDLDIYAQELNNFYSVDGTGNNPHNFDYGSVGSDLLNLAPLAYGDRISSPGGASRPNARVISNTLGQQDEIIESDRGLTNFSWAFGQFVDHDIILTPEDEGAEVVIAVPSGDLQLDPEGTGTVTIPLDATAFTPETGTDPENPAQIANQITAWVDGSNIYGSDQERNDYLRSGIGGELKVSPGDLLPLADESLENANPSRQAPTSLFAAGDVRGNENSVLVSIHTLFVREHNRLAQELAIAHPNWTDEQLYQRARQINIAQYQAIVYHEYLPSILGDDALTEYTGYDSRINPSIDRSFATAGFRIGHTQLSSEILRLDFEGEEISAGHLTLAESFFRSTDAVQADGIDPILRGLSAASSQNIDLKLIDDVRNLLFTFGSHVSGRDLLAINLERGRINGISDYNTVRESYGLPKVISFGEITEDTEVQQLLENLYGNVDQIDLFIGLLAEDHLPGVAVGETFQTIIARQFMALRDGDRFYYENIFSESEITAIESTTLAEIVQRNTDSPIIQDNAFSLLNEGTPEEDRLQGGLGDDSLFGGEGNDLLFGLQGDDLLVVDGGQNILEGGAGDDTYQVDINSQGSVIDDAAGRDKLVLTDKSQDVIITVGQSVGDAIGLTKLGDDLVIDLDRNGVADESNDLKVIDFFDGAQAGSGLIEEINNVSGLAIVKYFDSNRDQEQSSIHSFFRADVDTYFHTASVVERDAIIQQLPNFIYQGGSFQSAQTSEKEDSLISPKAVYRFLNRSTGVHLYTISELEKDYVIDNLDNYNFEDIAYYAYDTPQENTTELYRYYNSVDDFHFYTTSIEERDTILENQPEFRPEGDDGIAFYVQLFDDAIA